MIEYITFEFERTHCAGRLYRPEGSGPFPLVVMGAGLGGVMECGLAPLALPLVSGPGGRAFLTAHLQPTA
jgi:hypothetical protein